jgi:hypothetical protein
MSPEAAVVQLLGDPLPEEIQVLPTRQALEAYTAAVHSPDTREDPLPGDPTFRDYINDVHKKALITDKERLERVELHDLIIRSQLVAGEQAVLAEADALMAQGVLFESPPSRRTPQP